MGSAKKRRAKNSKRKKKMPRLTAFDVSQIVIDKGIKTSFAWVGAQSCEGVFLNDFRWSEKIIPWHDYKIVLF